MHFWVDWSDGKNWAMGVTSALMVAATVAMTTSWLTPTPGPPEQTASFEAMTGPEFGIQGRFVGEVIVRAGVLEIRVERAEISYPARGEGYAGPRKIENLRISLVEAAGSNWRSIRTSEVVPVGSKLQAGGSISVDAFEVTMDLQGLESISANWLVVDIADSIPGEVSEGLYHAHTNRLFSD